MPLSLFYSEGIYVTRMVNSIDKEDASSMENVSWLLKTNIEWQHLQIYSKIFNDHIMIQYKLQTVNSSVYTRFTMWNDFLCIIELLFTLFRSKHFSMSSWKSMQKCNYFCMYEQKFPCKRLFYFCMLMAFCYVLFWTLIFITCNFHNIHTNLLFCMLSHKCPGCFLWRKCPGKFDYRLNPNSASQAKDLQLGRARLDPPYCMQHTVMSTLQVKKCPSHLLERIRLPIHSLKPQGTESRQFAIYKLVVSSQLPLCC